MVNGVAVLFRMPPSWSDGTSSRGSRQDAVVGYVDLQQLMMKIFRVWAEETCANLPAPGLVSSSDDERSRAGEGTLFNEGEGSGDSDIGGDALPRFFGCVPRSSTPAAGLTMCALAEGRVLPVKASRLPLHRSPRQLLWRQGKNTQVQIQASVLSPTVYTHGDAGMGCVDAKQRAYVKLTRANTMRVRSPERGGMGVGHGDDIDRIYVALTRRKALVQSKL